MAQVIPLKRNAVEPPSPPKEKDLRCVVCGGDGLRDDWHCSRCGASMHDCCYLGRVMSMSEWLEYVRFINSDDENYPAIYCPSCRFAIELGDNVMPARPKAPVLRMVPGGQPHGRRCLNCQRRERSLQEFEEIMLARMWTRVLALLVKWGPRSTEEIWREADRLGFRARVEARAGEGKVRPALFGRNRRS